MFDQSLLPEGRTRTKSTFTLALAIQVLVIGLAILIPMVYVDVLPMPQLSAIVVAPPPPAPPPPPPPPNYAERAAPVVHKVFNANLYEPRIVPKAVAKIEDAPSAPQLTASNQGVAGGVAGGQVGGVVGGILGALPSAAPVPPPKPPEQQKVVRVGGNVQAAKAISQPKPTYPFAAKQARVEGTVRLKAVIAEDGHIKDLKAISGSPLLVGAALDAVRKWVYRPTYLNGKPVQVETEIDVQFQLAG